LFVEQVLGLPFDTSSRTQSAPRSRRRACARRRLRWALPPERQRRLSRAQPASFGRQSIALHAAAACVVTRSSSRWTTESWHHRAAREHDAPRPYGGGIEFSGASVPGTRDARSCRRHATDEPWLAIDRGNGCALVEAGITGAALEDALGALGYTSGHTPDSLEFSTLGGWISTNASGMKKNRYGNIEDIVIEATLVTPSGTLETRRPAARTSAGMQPMSLLFGSEGNLGVITKALIAIHPKPEEIRYQSLVFRSFGDGVAFLKAVRTAGALPASIRLVNNREFRFGQALRPAAHGAARWKSTLQRAWVTRVLGFDPSTMAACTIVMEGTRSGRRAGTHAASRRETVPRGVGRRRKRAPRLFAYVRDRLSARLLQPVRHRR
jgi:FAD/FMN-containing dehydrogenase